MQKPICNDADNGRPDDWDHTEENPTHCYPPTPPDDIKEALPHETRKIRMRAEELVTYQFDLEVPIHVGVTADALAAYLDDHPDLWVDHLGDDSFYSCSDREVIGDRTYYTDDAGYLEALASFSVKHLRLLQRWLTVPCPVCKAVPADDDTTHRTVAFAEPAEEGDEQKVNQIVAIACDGSWVVEPNRLGIYDLHWKDWTKNAPVVEATLVDAPTS
ncbi:hypothetical protein ACFQX6_11410 [Streptosporangium lutulentum]